MIFQMLISIVVLIGLSLVSATWLSAISIFGARPDLGLLAVVWLAYRNGPIEGSSAAFVSGLFDDAMSAAPLGFNAAVKTMVAWIASFLHGSVHLDRILMPFLVGAAATFIKALWSTMLSFLFGGKLESYDFMGRALYIEAAYNAVLAPILFAVLGGIFSLIDAHRHGSK